MLYRKIDDNGLFIEDLLLDTIPLLVTGEPDAHCIGTPCPDGFYKPKWNGAEWVEGFTQLEIDVIKNTPQQVTNEEKIKTLENDNALLLEKATKNGQTAADANQMAQELLELLITMEVI